MNWLQRLLAGPAKRQAMADAVADKLMGSVGNSNGYLEPTRWARLLYWFFPQDHLQPLYADDGERKMRAVVSVFRLSWKDRLRIAVSPTVAVETHLYEDNGVTAVLNVRAPGST